MATTVVATSALIAGMALVASPPAAAADRNIALILDYRVVWWCPVYTNYPKKDVSVEQAWWITPADIVAWRYNVNSDWAMISDKKYRGSSSHAWWGFTPRVCIGGSVGGEPFPTPTSSYPAGVPIPSRILEGRSTLEADMYRTVNFTLHLLARSLIRTRRSGQRARCETGRTTSSSATFSKAGTSIRPTCARPAGPTSTCSTHSAGAGCRTSTFSAPRARLSRTR